MLDAMPEQRQEPVEDLPEIKEPEVKELNQGHEVHDLPTSEVTEEMVPEPETDVYEEILDPYCVNDNIVNENTATIPNKSMDNKIAINNDVLENSNEVSDDSIIDEEPQDAPQESKELDEPGQKKSARL